MASSNFVVRHARSGWSALGQKFSGSHQSNDFNYVLQPFFCIFKCAGLLPLTLTTKNGSVMHAHWDVVASLATLAGFVCCIVGFYYGVEELNHRDVAIRLRESSFISYVTTWGQIFMLFALGTVALITSWTNVGRMRTLCGLVFRIDDALRHIGQIRICYRSTRRRLFVEFVVAMLVPVTLSMVNCTVVQPMPNIITWNSPCYWFICFAPILLLTLKEFQFFNLMFVLRAKFRVINAQLRTYGGIPPYPHSVRKVLSVSEIPLTAVSDSTGGGGGAMGGGGSSGSLYEQPTVADLTKLLAIYSNIGDGVELLLQIFSWHLVLMTTASFGIITIQSYNMFAMFSHSLEMATHQMVITVGWILVQIVVIGINVGACSSTARTMASTGPLLHKIQTTRSSGDVAHILQLFSLEVLHRKHCFTAAGFFDMDNRLITSIIAAVTTYLVIIIQFHLTSSATQHARNATDLVAV